MLTHDKKKEVRFLRVRNRRLREKERFRRDMASIPCIVAGCDKQRHKSSVPAQVGASKYCAGHQTAYYVAKAKAEQADKPAEVATDGEAEMVRRDLVPAPRKRAAR